MSEQVRENWLTRLMNTIHAPVWLRTTFDHNRFTAFAALLAAFLSINVLGCQPRTVSPFSGKRLTRDQIDAEVAVKQIELNAERVRIDAEKDAAINILKAKYSALGDDAAKLNAQLGPAYSDLERKQAALTALIQTAQGFMNQSGVPVTGVLATVLGIMATGYGLDNRRKDTQIQESRRLLSDPTIAILDQKLGAPGAAVVTPLGQVTPGVARTTGT